MQTSKNPPDNIYPIHTHVLLNKSRKSISYKIASVSSEDSDQPAHPRSLIRLFAGHSVASQGSKACSDGQLSLWTACAFMQSWTFMKFCRKFCIQAQILLQNMDMYTHFIDWLT